jgi:hypothetical protein
LFQQPPNNNNLCTTVAFLQSQGWSLYTGFTVSFYSILLFFLSFLFSLSGFTSLPFVAVNPFRVPCILSLSLNCRFCTSNAFPFCLKMTISVFYFVLLLMFVSCFSVCSSGLVTCVLCLVYLSMWSVLCLVYLSVFQSCALFICLFFSSTIVYFWQAC